MSEVQMPSRDDCEKEIVRLVGRLNRMMEPLAAPAKEHKRRERIARQTEMDIIRWAGFLAWRLNGGRAPIEAIYPATPDV